MTTYKAIHGKLVQSLASDPDSSAYEGQVWFNSTSSDFKTILKAAGAWSTSNNTNRSGTVDAESCGTQTAAILVGGYAPSPTLHRALAETYNGSSWTEVGDLNTARYGASLAGTQTAAVNFGGLKNPSAQSDDTETWDGSSWTEVSDMNTARHRYINCCIKCGWTNSFYFR